MTTHIRIIKRNNEPLSCNSNMPVMPPYEHGDGTAVWRARELDKLARSCNIRGSRCFRVSSIRRYGFVTEMMLVALDQSKQGIEDDTLYAVRLEPVANEVDMSRERRRRLQGQPSSITGRFHHLVGETITRLMMARKRSTARTSAPNLLESARRG